MYNVGRDPSWFLIGAEVGGCGSEKSSSFGGGGRGRGGRRPAGRGMRSTLVILDYTWALFSFLAGCRNISIKARFRRRVLFGLGGGWFSR